MVNMLTDEVTDYIPEGIHRCRILSAVKDVSKSGRDIIRVRLEIYGFYTVVRYYITFVPENPAIASRSLEDLFSSCPGIDGEFTLSRWIGHELACEIVQDRWNGVECPKVRNFVPYKLQHDLPHFQKDKRGVFVF